MQVMGWAMGGSPNLSLDSPWEATVSDWAPESHLSKGFRSLHCGPPIFLPGSCHSFPHDYPHSILCLGGSLRPTHQGHWYTGALPVLPWCPAGLGVPQITS
jgi:hypothetical protein